MYPSPGSLFHLPTREGFVYVENGDPDFSGGDDLDRMVRGLNRLLGDPPEPKSIGSPFMPYFEERNLEEAR